MAAREIATQRQAADAENQAYEDETISERISASLKEAVPQRLRTIIGSTLSWTMWTGATLFTVSSKVLWIVSSSFVILAAPAIPAMLQDTMIQEQENAERLRQEQERMLLAGPGGVSQYGGAPAMPNGGMPGMPPPMPQR